MKDLFEHIKTNKGNIGRWASHAEGYYVFPKLEGALGPHMKFQGKEVLNWSLNDYLGLANTLRYAKLMPMLLLSTGLLTLWELV